MDPKIYSKTWCEQSGYIGSGLNHPLSAAGIRFEKSGGDGLCWEIDWQGQTLRAWCSAHQWRRFVEAKIPHDELDEIEPALLQIASRWSWDSISADLDRANLFEVGTPAPGALEPDWYPVLKIKSDDKHLDFSLPEWPVTLLRQLSLGWLKNDADGAVNPVKMAFPAIAGWAVLSWTQLQRAGVGSILFPSGMRADTCYIPMDNTLVEFKMNDNSNFTVVAIHDDSDGITVENQSAIASLQNVPVSVMVEIGRVGMALSQLSALSVGECLGLDIEPGKNIRLSVNGCAIGYGELIRLEDRMGVRITRLF
ncbi:YscQ/HrcQ family type III secretion apparatus protein [Salmonella enterica]|nr:YscQ/HrcQ family type III secretion apparatus protein [Salmonella enterica]EFQ6618161.1 YscQ/HrcQ family type III secretion apparatus protein [Salmonella enterica]